MKVFLTLGIMMKPNRSINEGEIILCPAVVDKKALEVATTHFGAWVHELITTNPKEAFDHDVNYKPRLIDPAYDLVQETLMQDFSGAKTVPISIEAVAAHPHFISKRPPGIPFKKLNVKTNADAIEHGAFKEFRAMWNKVPHRSYGKQLPEVILYSQSEIAERYNTKEYTICEYPLTMFLEESRYVYPLLQALSTGQYRFPMAVDLEMANGGMKAINEMLRRHPDSQYTII